MGHVSKETFRSAQRHCKLARYSAQGDNCIAPNWTVFTKQWVFCFGNLCYKMCLYSDKGSLSNSLSSIVPDCLHRRKWLFCQHNVSLLSLYLPWSHSIQRFSLLCVILWALMSDFALRCFQTNKVSNQLVNQASVSYCGCWVPTHKAPTQEVSSSAFANM